MKATLYFDGSNRLDFTRASGGIVLELPDRTVIAQKRTDPSKFAPDTKMTNNIGEYTGLALGLREVLRQNVQDVLIFGDSKVIINQITGEFRVKEKHLKDLHAHCSSLLVRIPKWTIQYIPRLLNKADKYSRVDDDDYSIRYL